MMKTNRVNNQPAFGMIKATVKNNLRTGLLNECDKLAGKLSIENKLLMVNTKNRHTQESSTVECYSFILQCKKKNRPHSTNYKGETDLLNRIQKWAHRKGFGKIEFERE